jgi:hypothetical protein
MAYREYPYSGSLRLPGNTCLIPDGLPAGVPQAKNGLGLRLVDPPGRFHSGRSDGVDRPWSVRQAASFLMRGWIVGCFLNALTSSRDTHRFVRWMYVFAALACLFGLVELVAGTKMLTDSISTLALPKNGLSEQNFLHRLPSQLSISVRPIGTQATGFLTSRVWCLTCPSLCGESRRRMQDDGLTWWLRQDSY